MLSNINDIIQYNVVYVIYVYIYIYIYIYIWYVIRELRNPVVNADLV